MTQVKVPEPITKETEPSPSVDRTKHRKQQRNHII
jgi:hypothetical protein